MKKWITSIFSGLFLASCTSEPDFVFAPDSDSNIQDIKCRQAVFYSGDSIGEIHKTESRGWELPSGELYPCDAIYIAKIENEYKDKYGKPKNVIRIPVSHGQHASATEMCFQHQDPSAPDFNEDNEDVFMTGVDGSSIKLKSCIFSSQPLLKGEMTKSASIKTPQNSKPVYEPFGDRLFLTKLFTAEYDYDEAEDGDPEEEEIELEFEGGAEVEFENGRPATISLERYTSVLDTKLIITNLKKGYTYSLKEFEKTFGSIGEWSVRVFLNNAPVTFDYTQVKEYKHPTGSEVIALSQYQLPLAANLSYEKYKGIGADDESNPHIFPMKNKEDSEICYSFYYTGDKNRTIPVKIDGKTVHKKILPATTIRIPLKHDNTSFYTVEHNTKYILTHLVDLEDFKKGVTGVFDKKSRVGSTYDPVFGHVADIPTKQILKVQKGI